MCFIKSKIKSIFGSKNYKGWWILGMLFNLQSIFDKTLAIPIEVSVASPTPQLYILIYLREVNLNCAPWDQIGFIVVLYKFLSQECVFPILLFWTENYNILYTL